MKWPTVQLGKIAIEMQPGFARQPDHEEAGIPHLRTNNVSEDGRLDLSSVKTVTPSKDQIEKYSLVVGDILFNNTNSPVLVGKTAFFNAKGEFLFSNHMTRIRVNEKVAEPRFIARYLHWIWKSGGFRAMVTQWVNQAAINRSQLAKLVLPLPPLSEQRRIVKILDQADALRKKRAEADAKAERILNALFIKMFGDPVANQKSWELVKVSDLSIDFRYGTSTKCSEEASGLPVLRIPNILRGEVDLCDLKYAELPMEEVDRLLLQRGDLLFVRTNGNRDYVGRCAVFNLETPYLFASYLIRARLQQDKVDPWYVGAYLHTSSGRQAMSSFIRTTAGQSNISLEGLRQIPIPLPPLAMQQRFRAHVEHLYWLRKEREKSGNSLDTTFSCLLHLAFSGNLTANWREAHMKELLAEMEQQTKYLAEGKTWRHLENTARQESLF